MIAKYNNNYYIYVANKRKKILLTRDGKKADETFSFDNKVYRKDISEDAVSDIFNLEIMVLYESGFAGVPDWWTVGHESPLVDKDGTILLIFAEGFLPGWNVVEKNVCSCRIPVDSIQMVKLILSYKKIEGECRFTREERLISPLRFAQLLDTQGGICV